MKNFLRNTYLKVKDLFPTKPKKRTDQKVLSDIASILDRYNYHGPEVTDESLIKQLNEWQELSGIMDWKNRVIREKAVNTIYHEDVKAKIEEFKSMPDRMDHLRSIARRAAERIIEAEERAKYYGIQMEMNLKNILDDTKKIEDSWKKYYKASGDSEETASLFSEFLEKRKYLTKRQVSLMTVSAVFIGGKISNPLHFHKEMKRVKQNAGK